MVHIHSYQMACNMDEKKIGYTKPDHGLDRERERKLVHIATRGVTQLFNAVAERQQFMESKIQQITGKPMKERKRIVEELKEYKFESDFKNEPSTNGVKNKRRKMMAVVESKESIEPISSGPEDTDIEIKEEVDNSD